MDSNRELAVRLALIAMDERLSVWHIGIYVALLHLWSRNHMTSPFQTSRRAVMKLARVGSIVTYHKCVSELAERGYISYQPSYDPYEGSRIYIR